MAFKVGTIKYPIFEHCNTITATQIHIDIQSRHDNTIT